MEQGEIANLICNLSLSVVARTIIVRYTLHVGVCQEWNKVS